MPKQPKQTQQQIREARSARRGQLEHELAEIESSRAAKLAELQAHDLEGAYFVLFNPTPGRGYLGAGEYVYPDFRDEAVTKFDSPRAAFMSLGDDWRVNPISGSPIIRCVIAGEIAEAFRAEYRMPNESPRLHPWLNDWHFFFLDFEIP